MEQLQMQAAQQVMQQRQSDLQNKIQSNAYAQALAEQEAQVSEFDAFQTFNNDVSNWNVLLSLVTPDNKKVP